MQVFSRTVRLMGNTFAFSVAAEREKIAFDQMEIAVVETRRIESLLTTFSDTSQTNKINARSGISPVKVDAEVFDLIERSIAISRITQGAFDISYGSIDKKLWNFDCSMQALPDAETARKMVHLIDFRNIELDAEAQTVFLRNKGMRIGFGGIGKGYAAEMGKRKLIAAGVESGIINASGDLTAWGKQPSGKSWTIGIADPERPNQPFSYLDISDKAVATSGNYEKFAMIGGRKYSHTIDPKTGFPITGIKSVTTICDNAEFADAMATPIAVMGISAGLHLVDQIPGLHCIIVDDYNKIYSSKNINLTS